MCSSRFDPKILGSRYTWLGLCATGFGGAIRLWAMAWLTAWHWQCIGWWNNICRIERLKRQLCLESYFRVLPRTGSSETGHEMLCQAVPDTSRSGTVVAGRRLVDSTFTYSTRTKTRLTLTLCSNFLISTGAWWGGGGAFTKPLFYSIWPFLRISSHLRLSELHFC